MPDQPRQPLAALHPLVPEDVREFVRCRRDSVDIAPQTFDLPNFGPITLSFDDAKDGAITVRLDAAGDFLDSSILVTIQDGHLAADTSKVPFGRGFVDKWIEGFNADLDASPTRQLSSVSIRNGKLHVTKSPVISGTATAVTPPVALPLSSAADDVTVDAPDGPPPARLPDHVLDPIPPPVKVEPEEVVTETNFTPDLTDLGTDAVSDAGVEDVEPKGTEGSAAGERVHIEPSDIAVGHLGTEDLTQDARPQPKRAGQTYQQWLEGGETEVAEPESGAATEDEQDSETSFIEDPPISDGAKRLWNYRTAAGVVLLGAIGIFLFANRSNDTPVVSPTSQEAGAVGDPEPVPDEEPVSGSVQATDPVGDNGSNGAGADILGLEYSQGDTFTVLLTMGNPPLQSSVLWFSYYLEVTLRHFSGAIHVLIWENHAGESRSGELDSDGNTNGVGVTLTDEAAEFQVEADADDPVAEISVVARSLVSQDDSVAEDTMKVDVGTP